MFKGLIGSALFIVTASVASAQVQPPPVLVWKKQVVNVSAADGNSESNPMVLTRVLVQHQLSECGHWEEAVTEFIPNGTCYDRVCTGSSSGKSPAWDEFYAAKKELKANKLAEAIKGVGKSSAQALVDGGYFNSKPHSWDEFKTQIKKAQAAGAINEQVKTLVLNNFAEENMSKLGYNGGGCQKVAYTCSQIKVIEPTKYISQTCDVPVESPIETKAMVFKFHVTNSVLLPSEQESLKVVVSGDSMETQLEPAYYNKYQVTVNPVSNNSAEIFINGLGRNQVALPADSIQSVNLISTDKSSASLQVSVNPAALPATNSETLNITYTVQSCKIAYFGKCGLGWDQQQVFNGVITNGVATFPVATSLQGKKGLRMQVDVEIYKPNSIFHAPNKVKKSTQTIDLK